MELRTLWKVIRRRWWLILLPSLAALIYALYGYIRQPPGGGYSTSIRFTAAQPPGPGDAGYEDSRYYPWLTSEYIVNALTDWAKTTSFAQEVSAELERQGTSIPVGALQGRINADNERSVLVLMLSWPSADELAEIAEAATTVLQERNAVFFPQLGEQGATVIRLDEPAVGLVPPPLSQQLDPLIRLGLGVAAGVALAFLVDYIDPTLRDRGEVEALGLPVLAAIPRHRRARIRD